MKNQNSIYLGVGGVVILGLMVFGINQNYFKNLNQPQLSPRVVTTNTTDDRKTYTNAQYGYSIKYPSTLTPIETLGDVVYLHQVQFKNPKMTSISGITVEVKNFTTLEDEITFRKWQVEGHIIPGKIDSEEPGTVSGLPGEILNYTSGKDKFSIAIVPYKNLVYTITTASNKLYEYNQLLSTFKIFAPTTSTNTSNWTLYINKTFGYSMQFPETYNVPPQTEKEISQLGIDNNIGVEKKSDTNGSSVIVIDVYPNKENVSLTDYMNSNLKMFGITGPLVSYSFNGYDSLINKNQPGTNVFVKQGNNVYHITASTASLDKEIRSIIATFKFTQ